MTNTYKPGDKIKFAEEVQRYTVMVSDERFAICVKPFNAKKTFIYTIVDFKEEIRGADNFKTKHNYSRKEECELALQELNTLPVGDGSSEHPYTAPKLEISRRNRIVLNIGTGYEKISKNVIRTLKR